MESRSHTAVCPECGMDRQDWATKGYTKDDDEYCCRGCAEGTGCTCVTAPMKALGSEETEAKKKVS